MIAKLDSLEYEKCTLCPRSCGVNRTAGQTGVCGETATCRAASIEAHLGEEPPLSGTRGSGTVFFTGCPARCVFCQNHQISHEGHGRDYTPEILLSALHALIAQGVHNINFVTPEHMWPHIKWLVEEVRKDGCTLPMVWNSSGYMDAGRVPEYAKAMDVFLLDYKFSDPDLAQRCLGDARYPQLAMKALVRAVECAGFLHPFDVQGRERARQGVLVRHLVLPGEVENSVWALEQLREAFGRHVPLSVMSQYQPVPGTQGTFSRTLQVSEYDEVCSAVERLGFTQVFIQELTSQTEFLPDFEQKHPFAGNQSQPV